MLDWIAIPLGYILNFIYSFVSNYGVSIILFTLIVKLILLPLSIKSQKSMAKTQKLAPLVQELQKKYANDQQKLNQEMMELYKANDAKPTAGCLPLLLQFPIIIALYRVIQAPIKYICRGDITSKIDAIKKIVTENPDAFNTSIKDGISKSSEIAISSVADNPLFKALNIAEWKIDYSFLGLDLSRNPSEALSLLFSHSPLNSEVVSVLLLLLIPVLAGVTSWLLTKLNPQQKQMEENKKKNAGQDEQPDMGKTMNMVMPLMSAGFTFMFSAGIGVYWIASNVFQIIQQQITFHYFKSREDETVVINTIKPNRKDSKKHR